MGLEDHFAEVHHSVDCTRFAIDPRFNGLEGRLGAVYYNFPHSGAVGGFFDGHPIVNWRHENLMRLFFRALRSFVKPGGSVKVASNIGAVGVRYSYIVHSALENEFIHDQTMPFMEWHLHRYGRSYGDIGMHTSALTPRTTKVTTRSRAIKTWSTVSYIRRRETSFPSKGSGYLRR